MSSASLWQLKKYARYFCPYFVFKLKKRECCYYWPAADMMYSLCNSDTRDSATAPLCLILSRKI